MMSLKETLAKNAGQKTQVNLISELISAAVIIG